MSKLSLQDAYKALGINENASISEIKSAYKKLALKTHPDKNMDDPQAAEKFRKISEAFQKIVRHIENSHAYEDYSDDDDDDEEYSDDDDFDEEDEMMKHFFDKIFREMMGNSGFGRRFNGFYFPSGASSSGNSSSSSRNNNRYSSSFSFVNEQRCTCPNCSANINNGNSNYKREEYTKKPYIPKSQRPRDEVNEEEKQHKDPNFDPHANWLSENEDDMNSKRNKKTAENKRKKASKKANKKKNAASATEMWKENNEAEVKNEDDMASTTAMYSEKHVKEGHSDTHNTNAVIESDVEEEEDDIADYVSKSNLKGGGGVGINTKHIVEIEKNKTTSAHNNINFKSSDSSSNNNNIKPNNNNNIKPSNNNSSNNAKPSDNNNKADKTQSTGKNIVNSKASSKQNTPTVNTTREPVPPLPATTIPKTSSTLAPASSMNQNMKVPVVSSASVSPAHTLPPPRQPVASVLPTSTTSLSESSRPPPPTTTTKPSTSSSIKYHQQPPTSNLNYARDLTVLTEMGFDVKIALEALQKTMGNLENALNFLLSNERVLSEKKSSSSSSKPSNHTPDTVTNTTATVTNTSITNKNINSNTAVESQIETKKNYSADSNKQISSTPTTTKSSRESNKMKSTDGFNVNPNISIPSTVSTNKHNIQSTTAASATVPNITKHNSSNVIIVDDKVLRKSTTVCKFFSLPVGCKWGDNCKFIHST